MYGFLSAIKVRIGHLPEEFMTILMHQAIALFLTSNPYTKGTLTKN